METGPVRVRREVLDALLRHARDEAPCECCGLLLGSGCSIAAAWPARNLLGSSTRYRIDPVDHFAAIRAARRRGLAVIGAYHSHPAAPAVPSERDVAELTYPDYLYVIVSLVDSGERAVRGYRPVAGNFQEVRIVAES